MTELEFEIHHLRKSYGSGRNALDGVDVAIERGSMNFLLGANGSGKSTLLKCLAGHETWNEGNVLRRGRSRGRDGSDFNAGLHFVSEDIVPPNLSMAELSRIYRSIHPKWDESVFRRLLDLSELSMSRGLAGASRGQRVQGLLALCLASSPETLLIDEATAVLDPFIRNRLMREIEALKTSLGTTVVIATNIATEVAGFRGRLLIMKEGKVAVDRAAERVREGFVKIRVPSETADQVAGEGFCFVEAHGDGSLGFIGEEATLSRIQTPYDVDRREISIEEIFLFYADRRKNGRSDPR